MAQSDVFAFERSGLGTFLFAEVGTETNGSVLTVFSVLARLGQDPWELAAQWTKLPAGMIIERLTQYITRMPLPEKEIHDAAKTAKRLILLLPSQTAVTLKSGKPILALPNWLPAVLAAVVLAISIGTTVLRERTADALTGTPTADPNSSTSEAPRP